MYRWLPVYALLLFCALNSAAEPRDEWRVAAMGDSITAGYNSRWPGDLGNARYSWSTGSRVPSHVKKLKAIIPEKVVAVNVAKKGATSHELQGQLEAAKFSHIDYLTLLIGANDVCDWPSDHETHLTKFRSNVKNILDKVITANREIRIIMPAIPNMYRLYQVGNKDCGRRWDFFEACPLLLHSSRSDEERQGFHARLVDANDTLEKLAENYENNVKFIGSTYDFDFTIDHVSKLDCFHPSIAGQKIISRLTWEEGWYL